MVDTGKFVMWAESFVIVFSFLSAMSEGKYKMSEIEIHPNPNGEPARIFSDEEIKQYDGSDPSKPLLMAVRGVVFDVTEGKEFYGKGAPYHILAAKDASYAAAKWSLDEKDMHHDLSTLTDEELKGLDEIYLGTYKKKYIVVGYMEHLMDEHANKIHERFAGEL